MVSETHIRRTVDILKTHYTGGGATDLGDPYRSLVATLLSARSRDEQVLKLLPKFFRRFPDVQSLAEASEEEVRALLTGIGMWRQKAKRLYGLSRIVMREHHGHVPSDFDALTRLPGVGRKTANIILQNCFDQPAIGVDTHVHRVTNRLGWVKTNTPAKTEAALNALVPDDLKRDVNRIMVKFGHYLCIPGRPRCWACPVKDLCAFKNKNLSVPKHAKEMLATLQKREEDLQKLRTIVTHV